MAVPILLVILEKCPHFQGIRCLNSYSYSLPLHSIWRRYHPAPDKGTSCMQTIGRREGEIAFSNRNGIRYKPNHTCTCFPLQFWGSKIITYFRAYLYALPIDFCLCFKVNLINKYNCNEFSRLIPTLVWNMETNNILI